MTATERIREVLFAHRAHSISYYDTPATLLCTCSPLISTRQTEAEHATHLAQVLVDTLGIEEEWGLYVGYEVVPTPRQLVENTEQRRRIRSRLVSGWVEGE